MKSRENKNGKSPIKMQIILADKRIQLSTGVFVNEDFWDAKKGKIKSRCDDADLKNAKLDAWADKYKKAYLYLLKTEDDFSIDQLKNKMFGEDVEVKTLIKLIYEHNLELEKMLGIDCTELTLQRFQKLKAVVHAFIRQRYHLNDFLLSNLSNVFLTHFDQYLKTEQKVGHNTSIKYQKKVMRVVNFAVNNGWMKQSPFLGYKVHEKPVKTEFLTEDELQRIENKVMKFERMEFIRKVFLFQCYTGLAYIDMVNFKPSNIIEMNGLKWLYTERTKTKIPVTVPLQEKALALLQEFPDGFPMISNQKTNEYLHEIAEICQIDKHLSTHVARRTFATLALTKGVSMESVSKMLGHTNITTTQESYARVVPSKILNEMRTAKFIKNGSETSAQ